MTNKEEKIVKNSEEIRESKKQALEFLDSHYFYAALDKYKELLKANPGDKDSHVGDLMASNKIDNEEKLIRYYQNLYSAEEYEIKLACEKEHDHIEEMCDRFCIPDYLERDEILMEYEYDLSYKSNVFSRKKQKEDILKLIDQDEHLSWLRDKGFKEISDILKEYDRRLDDAQEKDQESIRRIKSEYQRFLYKTYADVKELNRSAKEKKDKEYNELIEKCETCSDIELLRQLSVSFEKFKDYRDGEHYIELCQEKIGDLIAQRKQEDHRRIIENTLDTAKVALVTEKYSDAYDGFTQAISADPGNEEAYLGVLMSRTKTLDVDELFDYYKNLYSEEHYETLEACTEDSDHINEMVEKYYLPEYLEKETIRAKYFFDRSYKSCLNSRIKQEQQFKEEIGLDPVFEWLKKNGSQKIRKKIEELYGFYSLRVKEAQEEDRKNAERIKNDYQRFLFKTYSSVKSLYKRAHDRKEDAYRQLIKSFDLANSESELRDLISKLNELGEYKECSKYISLCYQKIDELKKEELDLSNSQSVESSLIAGRAYLSSGNTELANQSFEKVLSMDPENPRAYLGILMIETGSRNIDELVTYFANLYNEDDVRILEGCIEDTDHINEMSEKYHIPAYLEKETIEGYYAFDRHFESLTDSRIDQRDQFNEEVRMNPLLAKVAAGKDEEILSFLDRVRGEYEARIVESKLEDEKQRSSIEHIYDIYLKETDKTVLRIYEEKLREKNDHDEAIYQKNLEQFDKDLSEDELIELSERFDADYKDSASYIKKCQDRINEIRRNREKDKLEKLLENGNALLSNNLYRQAKDRFESYLEIDPDSEEAHLKVLMAEKKVSNIDALFEYYKSLYSEEILETKEAVEENTEHIDEICDKCTIPQLLERSEILKRYEFDRSYESLSETRFKQKRQIEDEIELDPNLLWLFENGSANTKAYINNLLATYEERVTEAEEEDTYLVKTIEKNYRTFIKNTDREVRSLYNDLIKEQNRRIKEAERERKEKERQLKEEAERQRLLEQEELRKQEEAIRLYQEKQEALRKEKQLQEKIAKDKEREEKLRIEKLLQKAEQQNIKEETQKQKDQEEKERLEERARKQAEKEKKKEEKRRLAEERKRLKAEAKQKAREEKKIKSLAATGEDAVVTEQRKPFALNYSLLAAAVSLIVLSALVIVYVIIPGNKYKNAVRLADAGNYDEAILAFSELKGYKDSEFKIKETTYKKADSLYNNKQLAEAANIFNNLRFDDSEDRVKQIKEQMIEEASIGGTILFGDYEQDGNYDNGKEMIEWIVLDEKEGSILVISKYGIEAQKYNQTSELVFWENSSLRSWLNGRFPDNAFSRERPSDVLSTTLTNLRLPVTEEEVSFDEIIPEEYETVDRLFLLNTEELEHYFPKEDDRKCEATEYSIENGVAANADNTCNWWLRDEDFEIENTAMVVRSMDGTIDNSMYEITNAVRPLMWLKRD